VRGRRGAKGLLSFHNCDWWEGRKRGGVLALYDSTGTEMESFDSMGTWLSRLLELNGNGMTINAEGLMELL